MADTTALKNRIRAAIKANDNQEITGPILQQALLDMVDELNGGTEAEALTRSNADSTLSNAISAEVAQRQSDDSALFGMINSETQRAQTEERALLSAIRNLQRSGYAFGGIAVTGTNPGIPSGNCFYIVRGAGTYTYFKNADDESIVLQNDGLYVLTYESVENQYWEYNLIVGIDDEPTAGSNNPVKSRGVYSQLKSGDFVFINQNSATLPNFDSATRKLDLGADPVIYCDGTRYQPAVIWTSDSSKYRAIEWLSPSVTSAQWLIFNRNTCEFSFKAWGYAPANYEKIVGGIRLGSSGAPIAANVPFLHTIDGTLQDIPDGSVTTPKLADEAVTTPKLADEAVTTPKLADEAVTLAKIASAAIDAAPTMNSNKLVESGGMYSQLQSGDFVFINQNSATLPNFDNSTQKLDLGADPVVYCDGTRYQPAVIWASDTTKFRAIEWLPAGTAAAQMLVFNRQTCEFAFKKWNYTPVNYEKIVGGIRVNSAGVLSANVPFSYTIDEVPESIPKTIANGLRVSLIFTNLSTGIVPPNVNTTTHIMTLGSDTGVEIGNTHYGTNNASVDLKPTNTTAFKLWFKTTNKTFYARAYSSQPDANSVLVGAYRWGGADVYLDFPFEVTFNGDPHSLGKYYNYSNLNTAPVEGEPIVLPSSAKKVTAIVYSQYGTMSYTGAQGFTIAENRYIIQGYNGGKLAIIDMREKSIKGQFLLASTGTNNHCNAISCGARYAASDVLPLLYISEAYGTYRLFVERVASDFGSSTLVQTITFTGTMPANHNGNSFAVDTYGNKLYMCVHTSDHNVQVYEFALPNPTGGDVTLTDADILTTFTVNGIDNIMQGVEYYNGRLYMPFGYGSASYPNEFHVIDITQQKVVSSIYLQGMLATEPEDCSFYGGMLAISRTTNTFDLYTFD